MSVQSMTNTDTRDVRATLKQIEELVAEGCEIIRVAVPDQQAAAALPQIIKALEIPVIAYFHFDHRLSLESIKAGVSGLRINPGNIGGRNRVAEVVAAAKERNVPIRIGVNAGSLEKRLLEKYNGVTPEAMVESALDQIKLFEELSFRDIKISL